MISLKRSLLRIYGIESELVKHAIRCSTERYFYWQTVRPQVTQQQQQSNDLNGKVQEDVKQLYEPVIGLEVHAQIQSASKLFSSAPYNYFARPNTQVTYFDLSLPGTLPVLNRRCVETAIRTALALDCIISRKSLFDRKHYFYGDMPNGYQITQQREPIARDGWIDFIVYDDFWDSINMKSGLPPDKWEYKPYVKRCRLKQIQLEQDSGKSLVYSEDNQNLIDLNRAGVPLMEFVFEPDLRSTLEVSSLVRELILRLIAIEACNCRMNEGALRIDVNISIRPHKSTSLGTRTEIKNMNSFGQMRHAVEYEIKRQSELLQAGKPVVRETLGFDLRTKKTFVMRDKEIVQDYRFMPEPNLPPILLKDSDKGDPSGDADGLIDIALFRSNLPHLALPGTIRSKLAQPEYQLTIREIYFLVLDLELRDYFFDLFEASKRKNGQEIYNYLQQLLTHESLSLEKWSDLKAIISTAHLAELIDLLNDKRITFETTIDVIKNYQQKDTRSPLQIVEQYNWWILTDSAQIEAICREVIKSMSMNTEKYAKIGFKKRYSMLHKTQTAVGNRVNEADIWNVYDKILKPGKESKE